MKKIYTYCELIILLITLFICSSCARELVIPYTSDSNADAQIVLNPIKPTEKTFITINDSLIVNKKFIKSVIIDHLPPGVYTINYASEVKTKVAKIDTTMTIVIEGQTHTTKIIDVPANNSWYYISNILIGLLLIVPFLFV